MPGESVDSAARRRAAEELGITLLKLHTVIPDYRYRAQKNGVVENETCPVLVGVALQQPVPNPAEVLAVRWVEWREFVESIRQQNDLTPWCKEEAELLDGSSEFHRILQETGQH